MAREMTLVDAGLGNLASVERALVQVGAAVVVTDDPDRVAKSRSVVFPGQGAFGARTDAVVSGAMGAALRMVIERGDPFLGICLGMQLLFDGSDEAGGREGLGVLPGQCRRFPFDMVERDSRGARVSGDARFLKVPHVGWNDVEPTGDHYYFVHSYHVEARRSEDVMWMTTYGRVRFPAAIRRANVLGCQFHPEKSQRAGLRFLRAFLLGGWA